MKAYLASLFALAVVLTVGIVVVLRLTHVAAPGPYHQASVYADSVNHGDMRAACSVIQPAVVRHLWHDWHGCQTYFTAAFGANAQFGSLGGYKLVPHSLRQWREGTARVARVLMQTPYGDALKVRLVRVRAGWRVQSVGA